MGRPAARVGDMHVCSMVTGVVPHVGGTIFPPGAATVLIGGMPAACIGDMAMCVGPPDVIISACATVLIEGKPAARLGDQTAHGGTITAGCFTVLLGEETAKETPRLILLCPDITALQNLPLDQRLMAEQAIFDRIKQIAPDKSAALNLQRHDRDMAVLANATYATKDGSPPVLPPGYSDVSDNELKELGVSKSFLNPDMKVYRTVGENEQPRYVLAFRGTELGAGVGTSVNDVGVDVLQGVGFKTNSYERANEAAKSMSLSGKSVELTGHSKGGGEAAFASAASGLPATTFNAAGVHERTIERAGVTTQQLETAQTNIRAYNNERDPLNAAQDNRIKVLGAVGAVAAYVGGFWGGSLIAALSADGALPPALGQRISVPPAHNQGMGMVEGHSMDTMVRAMDDQIGAKLKETCGC